MKNKIKNFLGKTRIKIALVIVPLVLLFSSKTKISWQDRLEYFFEVGLKSAPLLFLYGFFSEWYEENELFAISISTALFVNLLVGARFHWMKGTFDLGKMLWKNLEMLVVVTGVYLLLGALSTPLGESVAGLAFKKTIEFITILYPVSKSLRNLFILTDGKHPPKFVIQALYQYEKDGKLKDFFDSINGNLKNDNDGADDKI